MQFSFWWLRYSSAPRWSFPNSPFQARRLWHANWEQGYRTPRCLATTCHLKLRGLGNSQWCRSKGLVLCWDKGSHPLPHGQETNIPNPLGSFHFKPRGWACPWVLAGRGRWWLLSLFHVSPHPKMWLRASSGAPAALPSLVNLSSLLFAGYSPNYGPKLSPPDPSSPAHCHSSRIWPCRDAATGAPGLETGCLLHLAPCFTPRSRERQTVAAGALGRDEHPPGEAAAPEAPLWEKPLVSYLVPSW